MMSPEEVKYMSQLLEIPIKIHGLWHAGNYDPNDFMGFDFDDFYIQPMDSKSYSKNLKASLDFCMQNPRWSLSLQTHKILGIK